MENTKPKRPQFQLFRDLRIGHTISETGKLKTVTRLTDMVFDTIDNETGEIQVRNLGLLKNIKFQNTVSLVSI